MNTLTGGVEKRFQCINCLDKKYVSEPHQFPFTSTGGCDG